MTILFAIVAALSMAIYFIITVVKTLKSEKVKIRDMNDRMRELSNSNMSNMQRLDDLAREFLSDSLYYGWESFRSDVYSVFGGESAPNPALYISKNRIPAINTAQTRTKIMPLVFGILGLVAFILPFIPPFFTSETAGLQYSAGLGIASGVLTAVFYILVYIPYLAESRNLIDEFDAFLDLLRAKTVTTESPGIAAVLMRSNRETREAFEKAAGLIVEKLGEITMLDQDSASKTRTQPGLVKGIAALTEKVEALDISLKQAVDSNGRLASNLTASVERFAEAGPEQSSSSSEIANIISEGMTGVINTFSENLSPVVVLLEGSTSRILEALEEQNRNIGTNTREFNMDVKDLTLNLKESVEEFKDAIGNYQALLKDTVMKTDPDEALKTRSQRGLVKGINVLVEKIEALDVSLNQPSLPEALNAIGTDIAEKISKACISNTDLADRLAEQAEKLSEAYNYRINANEQGATTVTSNMDISTTEIVTIISEELTGVMNSFNESMSSMMERLEGSTSRMLEAFEEQSRDMGLYARELNMDVRDLTANLKESVEMFNKGLNEGIQSTFTEFDTGLTEFTARFANTVETIRDSVEALPSALKGR